MKKQIRKVVTVVGLILSLVLGMAGCGSKESGGNDANSGEEKTEIQVFIAASLQNAMTEIAEEYQKLHPDTKIVFNADSSGTLMTQIQEGYACDIFFSAAEKQMDTLEADKLVIEGTRVGLLQNRVVLVSRKDSGTKVKGFGNLSDAESIALAGGSVPVGKYTRQALVSLGILEDSEAVDQITTQEISDALGGVEISEQSNVSKVLTAVVEGSCEVGTVYYSDFYGYQDQLEVLEEAGEELTGKVIYPVGRIVNEEADEKQSKAADDFYNYLLSEEAASVFEAYYFGVNEVR